MNILITGASRGIGAELAVQLAKRKHRLFLIARDGVSLDKICKVCNETAGESVASALVFDLSKPEEIQSKLSPLLEGQFEVLDCLINNAAMVLRKPFEEISLDKARDVFDLNYFAPMELVKALLPQLRRAAQPSIINVSSMGAIQGSSKFPGLSAYSASKGALTTLTECLAVELEDYNIKVNALAFGAVQTEMLAEAFPGFKAGTSAAEMGSFFSWFVEEAYMRFNGKVLPVSDSTP